MNTSTAPGPRTAAVAGWAVLTLAALPGFLWIALDRWPFGGDQSQYATQAVTLFDTLLRSPFAWPSAMARTMDGFKAPGLAWIGQLFVPLGMRLGGVDRGLLALVTLTQVLALGLTYSALRKLAGNTSVALLGSLVTAAAPLQVMLSHEFLVEPLQMLGIAYFIWIMAFAPGWARGRTLAHLLLASSIAMLAKASAPLYCLGPGLFALVHAVGPSREPRPWAWLRPSTSVPLAAGSMLAVPTAAWYLLHLRTVRMHVLAASSGPVALYWGKDDTFLSSLVYWFGALAGALFIGPGSVVAATLLAAGSLAAILHRRRIPCGHFGTCAAIAAAQIAVVLAAFSLVDVRVQRYLLPCVPSCALLLSWGVARLRPLVCRLALLALGIQLVIVHGFAFGLISFPRLGESVRVIDRTGQAARVLETLVSSTCYDPSSGAYPVVIGIDPGLRGDWLAPAPAEYVRAKRRLTDAQGPRCVYDYLGGNFFGGTAAEVWQDMLSRKTRCLVMADPNVYPAPSRVYNRALGADQLPSLMKDVTGSGLFMPAVPLSEDRGILVFRRAEPAAVGRTSSDP